MGGVKRLIGEKAMTADQIKAAGLEGKAAEAAAKGSGFMGLGTGEKIGLTLAATSLLEDEDDVKPPFTDEDYKKAYEKNKKELEGITEGMIMARMSSLNQTFMIIHLKIHLTLLIKEEL